MKTIISITVLICTAIGALLMSGWLQRSCSLTAITTTNPINCFEFWLNRYQTLIAALIASVAASATILSVVYQTKSAERIARRIEKEAEDELRKIILSHTRILAEIWRGIDWALEGSLNEVIKAARAETIYITYYDTRDAEEVFTQMKALRDRIAPSAQIKIDRLILRWREMLDQAGEFPNHLQSKTHALEWIAQRRRHFTMLSRALDQYDPILGDVFAGLSIAFMKPDESAERTAKIRESLKRNHVDPK